MKIRIKEQLVSTRFGNFQTGETVDLAEDQALGLIREGKAEQADDAKKAKSAA